MPVSSKSSEIVKIGDSRGHTVIDQSSPLTRLNYFDGKFLRAPDLQLEQTALLNQVRLANQAQGGGLVHGFDCTLGSGDTINIGPGLAFDWQGRALWMGQPISIGIAELIAKSRTGLAALDRQGVSGSLKSEFGDCEIESRSLGEDNIAGAGEFYLIVLNHVEAHCGEDDVYGKLCAEACISSTARTHIIEGVEIAAVPLNLAVALKQSSVVSLSQKHLRSRVASAFFEQERLSIASLISRQGLAANTWCLGAELLTGQGIPIALVARTGTTTQFLDAWTVRRERTGSPPRQYWAARMGMRSWRIYLAQILQFQCQLRHCLDGFFKDPQLPPAAGDPCADEKALLQATASNMEFLVRFYAKASERLTGIAGGEDFTAQNVDLQALQRNLEKLRAAGRLAVSEQLLIECGIVELPSAGYLPVAPTAALTVNAQVRQLLGAGVDVRFCVVRPDFVPHALEEAQHMERICLLSGLDDPERKPRLDILVPDGEIRRVDTEIAGTGYRGELSISSNILSVGWPKIGTKDGRNVIRESRFARNIDAAGDLLSDANRFEAGRVVFDPLNLPAVSGAARGERIDAGHGFYMAGVSQARTALGQAGLRRSDQGTGSVLTLLDDDSGNEETDRAGAADTGGPSLEPTRGEGSAGNILSDASRLRDGLAINTNLAAANAGRVVPDVSLWLRLSTATDPFSLGAGGQTDVEGRLSMVLRSVNFQGQQQTHLEQRNITGKLVVESIRPQGSITRIGGRFIGEGLWNRKVATGSETGGRTESLTFDESVVISRVAVAGTPPTINITLLSPSFFGGLDGVQLVFEQIWTAADESTVRGFVRSQRAVVKDRLTHLAQAQSVEETDFLLGRFKADNAVLKPGNSFHSASVSAINTIAAATKDGGFVERASSLLFPAPEPVPDELEVVARLPWVLFHRRRDKVCEQAAAAEAAAPARRYRVFHVHLEGTTSIDELVAAIQADLGAVLGALEVDPVTVVDYAPGAQTITTTHGDLRADWESTVQVDADLHLGVIASQGDVLEEGTVLAGARLQSLTNLLSPVSQPAADLQLLTVSEVPPSLAAGEVDGAVVYFTKAVTTVCHAVYRLVADNPDAVGERIEEYLQSDSDESLPSFIQAIGGAALPVTPRFIDGGVEYFSASEAAQLDAAWDLAGDGSVTHAMGLSAEDDEAAQAVTGQQTQKIIQSLGSAVPEDDFRYRSIAASRLKPCAKASILLAALQCNEVYLFRAQTRSADTLVEELVKFIGDSGLTSEILKPGSSDQPSSVSTLGRVAFHRNSSDFEKASRNQFHINWQSQLAGNPAASVKGHFIAVARSGASEAETAGNRELAQKQAQALRALMGVSTPVPVAVTNNPEVDFPGDCPVITLLVVPTAIRVGITQGFMVMPQSTQPEGGRRGGRGRQPALNMALAESVRYDVNNAVVRDEAFEAALQRLAAADQPVTKLELVALEGAADDASVARAESLLAALREAGAAEEGAAVVVRKPDARETREIIRSGFSLNRGIVLR